VRKGIYVLGLACILLISCCKKGPTSPEIKPNPNLDPPTIVYFTANPSTIKLGEKSTLSWEVTDSNSVEIDGGIGTVDGGKSSIEVSPLETTTYTLTAKNQEYDYESGVMVGSWVSKLCTVTVEK
jgi:hypothetical protein